MIAIARKNERCEETDARARVPSATENLSRATYLFLGAAHDLLRRRSLSRRRRLLRRGLLDRRLRRRSLRLEHDDRRESSWCAAHRTFAVASVPPSVSNAPFDRSMEYPDRYRWNTDGTPRSRYRYRSNAPIERPDPDPDRDRGRGRDRGVGDAHTTSHDSSIDLDRGIPSGRSIWIGVIVRSFVRTDRGIPSIDRSISMAFVWITSTSRDSRKKMRPTGGTPSRAFRTTERASERRAGDARGRRESSGRSRRSCRSFVSFVSIVRVVRETQRGARGWLKCK